MFSLVHPEDQFSFGWRMIDRLVQYDEVRRELGDCNRKAVQVQLDLNIRGMGAIRHADVLFQRLQQYATQRRLRVAAKLGSGIHGLVHVALKARSLEESALKAHHDIYLTDVSPSNIA